MRKTFIAAVVAAAVLTPTTALAAAGPKLAVAKAERAVDRSLVKFAVSEELTQVDAESVAVGCERVGRRVVDCEYAFDAVDGDLAVACQGEATVSLTKKGKVKVAHDEDALDCEEIESEDDDELEDDLGEDVGEDAPLEEELPEL